MSLLYVPTVFLGASLGGWWLLLTPLYGLVVTSLFDAFTPKNTENKDPNTPDNSLFWYRLITLIWLPVQILLIFGGMWVAGRAGLGGWEKLFLFYGIGVATSTIGINYAHELIHQGNRLENRLGEWLLASVLYAHFRTEHLFVHHRYVGTPRDAVTARYGEGFYHYFARVLPDGFLSAWRMERDLLSRKNRPIWHPANAFWRYFGMQALFLLSAVLIGGWQGLLLFIFQAFVAVLYLEITNYVEHYGLTRKHLGNGKYEHVKPRHSWNASHRVTNWLMINLQRHSDHHYKPDRRFPLLQTYEASEAPQLPFGYPIMGALALAPKYWRKRMNPRVDRWRARHYPDITDWKDYNEGTTPLPR
ncbi:alkane 1-monooxygenase [Paracoccaceae bacterium GXU_MW_L88]